MQEKDNTLNISKYGDNVSLLKGPVLKDRLANAIVDTYLKPALMTAEADKLSLIVQSPNLTPGKNFLFPKQITASKRRDREVDTDRCPSAQNLDHTSKQQFEKSIKAATKGDDQADLTLSTLGHRDWVYSCESSFSDRYKYAEEEKV